MTRECEEIKNPKFEHGRRRDQRGVEVRGIGGQGVGTTSGGGEPTTSDFRGGLLMAPSMLNGSRDELGNNGVVLT